MGENLKMLTHSINNRGSQLAATLPFVNKTWHISFQTLQWRYLHHMKKGPLLRFRNWCVRANHLSAQAGKGKDPQSGREKGGASDSSSLLASWQWRCLIWRNCKIPVHWNHGNRCFQGHMVHSSPTSQFVWTWFLFWVWFYFVGYDGQWLSFYSFLLGQDRSCRL